MFVHNTTNILKKKLENSLYRPGPMANIPEFINRREGKSEIKYLHRSLENILKETCGIIVYQEQVMQIASKIGRFSLAESDLMRRAMGKKKKNLMASFKVKFVEGAAKNKIAKNLAIEIFELLEKFAQYGFVKSHAVAYSVISYQTAWLKAHYPQQFMAAVLSSGMATKAMVLPKCTYSFSWTVIFSIWAYTVLKPPP